MSASLDKSLDDIISSAKRAKRAPKGKAVGKAVGKGVGKAKKPAAVSFKKEKAQTAPAFDISYATKVMAHGLPRDIKGDAVKVCLARDAP